MADEKHKDLDQNSRSKRILKARNHKKVNHVEKHTIDGSAN